MDTARIEKLVGQLDLLRRRQMELEGDDPGDASEYLVFPGAAEAEIAAAEAANGMRYPDCYRRFLALHNGWRGFWPDWHLMGVPREDNKDMYTDLKMNLDLLPKVVGPQTLAELPERERHDDRRILLTNHPILGLDLNGSFLVFDRYRNGPTGDPVVAWVHFLQHVERRWSSFEYLFLAAIEDTESEITDLTQSQT